MSMRVHWAEQPSLTKPSFEERQIVNTHSLLVAGVSESDIEPQKGSKAGRRTAKGRQNAISDATPDIQPPGTIEEIGKEEVGKEKAARRASSRGDRSRQR
jgi:hypothetical protein